MARKFGWKRDTKDHRDWKFKHVLKQLAGPIPTKVDLRAKMSIVENQANIGSCVANAVVGAMEHLELIRLQGRFRCFSRYKDLSRLFVYYNARLADGAVEEDGGTTIRTAIKTLAEFGVCEESVWPYDTDRWPERPSDKAYDKAKDHTIRDYYRASPGDETRQALALGFPVAFGTMVYDSFQDVSTNGKVLMPRAGEQALGGHAMLIVGYDMEKDIYIVRNSWGTDWSDKGYCYFPTEYIENGALSDDFWVIRK
jgi:C1A family cysteine protease